ncbi:MAG: response regulator transcription factor [Candidatus Acidiferrales bacterium]
MKLFSMDSSPETQPTTAGSKVRILVADDHVGVRKAVRNILDLQPGFQVVGEALDGEEAVRQAKKLKPDVVVLNVQMPMMNGIEAGSVIKADLPEVVIVVLSLNADQRLVEAARKIGARAYVAKTRAGDALVKAIEAAIAGGDFVLVE